MLNESGLGSLEGAENGVAGFGTQPPESSADGDEEDGDATGADAGPVAVADATVDPPEAAGGALLVSACTEDGGRCLIINVAVSDATSGSCVQLALDDCELYNRGSGLDVDLPVSWRLSSASVVRQGGECLPAGDFDPSSAVIVRASGAISWNQDSRGPADLALDVELQPAASAADPSPTNVAGQIAGTLPECPR